MVVMIFLQWNHMTKDKIDRWFLEDFILILRGEGFYLNEVYFFPLKTPSLLRVVPLRILAHSSDP